MVNIIPAQHECEHNAVPKYDPTEPQTLQTLVLFYLFLYLNCYKTNRGRKREHHLVSFWIGLFSSWMEVLKKKKKKKRYSSFLCHGPAGLTAFTLLSPWHGFYLSAWLSSVMEQVDSPPKQVRHLCQMLLLMKIFFIPHRNMSFWISGP